MMGWLGDRKKWRITVNEYVNEYLWNNENVLQSNCSDGCTVLLIYKKTLKGKVCVCGVW